MEKVKTDSTNIIMPKYTSVDTIPARIFFEILKTKNLQLLRPKPSENTEDLEQLFLEIYDEYFIRSENKDAAEYLKLSDSVTFLTYKINTIKRVLAFLYYNRTTKEMRIENLNALRKHCGIEINVDTDFTDEVKRILEVEIGMIQNDLNFDQMQLDTLRAQSDKKIFDYYESLVQISGTYPYGKALDEKMTLGMYIAETKEAVRRSRLQTKTPWQHQANS